MHQESTFSATRAHSLPFGLVRPVIRTTGQVGVWTVDFHEPEVPLRRRLFPEIGCLSFQKKRGCCNEPRMCTQIVRNQMKIHPAFPVREAAID